MMAEPIRKIKRLELSKEDIQAQHISEVLDAVSENKDSIIKGINLLSTIDETGALDIVNALAIHRKIALEKLIEEINKERYAGSLENIMPIFTLLGTLKVDEISYFVDKLNKGMKNAKAFDESEKTTYMNLITALKDPEVNRSITMILQFLKGMGKE